MPPSGPPRDAEPTPQQAARALREMTARRHQVLRLCGPRWLWWLGGAWFPASGFAEDALPQAAPVINLSVIGLLLTLALSVRYRPVGAALGYRVSVRGRPPVGVSLVTIGGVVAIDAVELAVRQVMDQMHSHWGHTVAGMVAGPLFALGMPWLIEQANRDQAEMGRDGG